MATSNTVNTELSRDKFAEAEMNDGIVIPEISQVAFGNDGYDDVAGEVKEPSSTATQVPGEFIKKAYESLEKIENGVYRINFQLDYIEGDGQDVSSCGLYDSDGDLIAIKNFEPITKTTENQIVIEWDRQF